MNTASEPSGNEDANAQAGRSTSRVTPAFWAFVVGGAAVALGSLLTWISVSAPFIGTITRNGLSYGDGWYALGIGALLLVIAGLAYRQHALTKWLSIAALVVSLGAVGFAVGEIIYIFVKASDVRSALSTNPDDLGLGNALSQAVSVDPGAGVWVVLVAGIVATVAAIRMWKKPIGAERTPRVVTTEPEPSGNEDANAQAEAIANTQGEPQAGAEAQTQELTAQRTPWWRRKPTLIVAGCVVAVLLAGGITLAVVRSGGPDSGVAACRTIRAGSPSGWTPASIKKVQSEFQASSDEALRTAGLTFMKFVAATQPIDENQLIAAGSALDAACARHGVQMLPANAQNPTQEATPAPSGPTPSPSVDCSDPNLDQNQWMNNCASPPPAPAASIGEPFAQTAQTFDESGTETDIALSMTVKKLTCGISSFGFTAESASGAIQNDQPADAEPGKQFCRANVSIKNVGTSALKDGVNLGGTTLTAAGKSYAADEFSQAITYTINDQLNSQGVNTSSFAGDVLNPGDTARQAMVWQIPASATVDTIDFTAPPSSVSAQ